MRVLLVEDEVPLGRLWTRDLSAAGVATTWVETLADGVGTVARSPFDVVVLDLKLPDGWGLELLKELRQRGDGTPGLVISAYGGFEAGMQAAHFAPVAFLAKPFVSKRLVEAILALAVGATPCSSVSRALRIWQGLQPFESPDVVVGALLRFSLVDDINLVQCSALFRQVRQCVLDPRSTTRVDIENLLDTTGSPPEPIQSALADVLSVVRASQRIRSDEIARACRLPPHRLRQVVLAGTGRDVRWWARVARVRRMLLTMLNSPDQLAQSAFAAGYPQARQAVRDFNDILGMSPGRVQVVLQATTRRLRVLQ